MSRLKLRKSLCRFKFQLAAHCFCCCPNDRIKIVRKENTVVFPLKYGEGKNQQQALVLIKTVGVDTIWKVSKSCF